LELISAELRPDILSADQRNIRIIEQYRISIHHRSLRDNRHYRQKAGWEVHHCADIRDHFR